MTQTAALDPNPSLQFRVHGVPRPQGSKKAMRHKQSGKIILLDTSPETKIWRHTVTAAAVLAIHPSRTGVVFTYADRPCAVSMIFWLPRPKNHYLPANSRRAEVELNPHAPLYPPSRPDIDKLVRATLDGLTDAGVYRDDAQVVDLIALKRYEDQAESPGAKVFVRYLNQSPRPVSLRIE